ncbi:methionyl-tRNA formyltransferase [Candidatus Nomurabacteria bacterium]|nr:methionyl-tRNA formyltransferase [Candidatus Nomurabacteria bacterium]
MIRTLFLGSNWEALATFRTLIDDDRFEIVGLITQPDKPIGRKKIIEPTEIKKFAQANHIKVFHTENEKKNYLQALDIFKPDLVVCKSFGELIPEEFINYPKYSTINVHYSLLPKFRGAVPIQKAILEGEQVTGITYVEMVKELDAGGILKQFKEPIKSDDTNQSLRERLVKITTETIGDILESWVNGEIITTPQNDAEATYCWQKDISKDNAFVDLTKDDPILAERMIRALVPWPVAWTDHNGSRLKIFKAHILEIKLDISPGEFKLYEGSLIVGSTVQDKVLRLEEVQPEGKKVMKGDEYARGQHILRV